MATTVQARGRAPFSSGCTYGSLCHPILGAAPRPTDLERGLGSR